jgi:hypothetical protein
MDRAIMPNAKQIQKTNADLCFYVYSGWRRVIVI